MAEKYDSPLSEKESEFCRLLVFDRIAKYKAYMQVFGTTAATSPAMATKLTKKKKIQEEMQRLRDMKSQDAEWEFEDSVNELKGVVRNPENQTVQVNALKELNKMFGWDKQTIDHTSSDGSMTPTFGSLYGTMPSDND